MYVNNERFINAIKLNGSNHWIQTYLNKWMYNIRGFHDREKFVINLGFYFPVFIGQLTDPVGGDWVMENRL